VLFGLTTKQNTIKGRQFETETVECVMSEKKAFEMPVITTYRRDELILETAFTLPANSTLT